MAEAPKPQQAAGVVESQGTSTACNIGNASASDVENGIVGDGKTSLTSACIAWLAKFKVAVGACVVLLVFLLVLGTVFGLGARSAGTNLCDCVFAEDRIYFEETRGSTDDVTGSVGSDGSGSLTTSNGETATRMAKSEGTFVGQADCDSDVSPCTEFPACGGHEVFKLGTPTCQDGGEYKTKSGDSCYKIHTRAIDFSFTEDSITDYEILFEVNPHLFEYCRDDQGNVEDGKLQPNVWLCLNPESRNYCRLQ